MKALKLLAISGAISSMLAISTHSAWATTTPDVTNLSGGAAISLGTGVKARGWYDERKLAPNGSPNAAYNKMWTHNSKWGYFYGESGKTYTVTVVSTSTATLHPGVTIWYRTNLFDNAGANIGSIYVKDHLLPQPGLSLGEASPTDSTTNDPVSRYGQYIQAWGYDQDGTGTKSNPLLHPIKDGVEGSVSLTFTATVTGTYLLSVGGAYPSSSIPDPTAFYPITVQVQEVTTAAPAP
jgi:hypothetical protein